MTVDPRHPAAAEHFNIPINSEGEEDFILARAFDLGAHRLRGSKILGHSCLGDSGSPLVARSTNGKFVLAGVATFGDQRCHASAPVGFARVTSALEWIREVVGEKQCF